MKLVNCTLDEHGEAILAILNHAILNSTALYEYKPRTMENMQTWFALKQTNAFPVIGAIDDDGTLMGFASYGTFRAFPAFKYTVEHSVYIHHEHRGKKLGKTLMKALIDKANSQGVHVLVGGIDASNEASIALHKQLGFTHSGTITQAGFKFGRWLDLAFYQLTLTTPNDPIDG